MSAFTSGARCHVDDSESLARTLIVTSRELTLSQQDLADVPYWHVNASRDLEVYADTVTIAGPLALPGRRVKIFARIVRAAGAASIRVDGPDLPQEVTSWPSAPPARDKSAAVHALHEVWRFSWGSQPQGTAGRDGPAGDAGKAAGAIAIYAQRLELGVGATLTLSAVGGRGGRGANGQPGGAGGEGADGISGTDLWDLALRWKVVGWSRIDWWAIEDVFRDHENPIPALQAGLVGGDGGAGGAGGPGGLGGARGTVVLSLVTPLAPGSVTIAVRDGAAGEPGNGAAGGLGGLVGRSYVPRTDRFAAEDRTQRGQPGRAGATPVPSPPPSPLDVRPASIEHGALLAQCPSPAYWSMTLERARDLYLAAHPRVNPEGFAALRDALAWIRGVLQPNAASVAASPLLTGTLEQTLTLLTRLAPDGTSHLDAFGHDYSYVPLPSFAVYTGVLDELLTHYRDLEQVSDAIFAAESANEVRRDHLDLVLAKANATIDWKTQQLEAGWGELEHVAVALRAADALLPARRETLVQALEGLEAEICRWADCAALQNVVRAFESCAFVPPISDEGGSRRLAAGGVAMLGIQGVDVLLGSFTSSSGLQIQKRNLIREVRSVEGDLRSLKEGYGVIDGLITEEDPNGGKLLATADRLRALLADLADKVTGIAECQADLDAYVSAVQLRNQQILTYNQIVARMLQLRTEIEDARRHVAVLHGKLSGTTDPVLSDLSASTSRLYQGVRDRVVEMFYLASRAFTFMAFRDDDSFYQALGLGDASTIRYAPTMTAARAYLASNYAHAVQDAGGDLVYFPSRDARTSDITLRIDDPHQLRSLKTHGQMEVSIPLPEPGVQSPIPAEWRRVRITRARPWIEGLRPKSWDPKQGHPRVSVSIYREGAYGDTFLVDEAGRDKRFVYDKVGVAFTYRTDTPFMDPDGIVSGDAQITGVRDSNYALVGPFGWWRIVVDLSTHDASDVTGVTVELFGAHRER